MRDYRGMTAEERRKWVEEIAAAEAAKGDKIAEGEDGVYVLDGEDPVIQAYNEGGHNSTRVASQPAAGPPSYG